MRWLADMAYFLAGLIYLPVALYHAIILGKNRRGWRQRFGGVPTFDPAMPRLWIHAVSLGEMNATATLAAALQRRLPDAELVFSSTTDTGYARGVALYGADRVFRFPLDFSPVVAQVLRRVRPSMIVLMELEVWYNLTRMAAAAGIPVVVVNGRLTARSAGRLTLCGRVTRSMFGDLTWVGAQDETIAARFRSVGVPPGRIEITSSLKWDTALVADEVEGADPLARALGIDGSRLVWVCGSTGPGEEEIILAAYQDLLRRGDKSSKFEVQSSKKDNEDELVRRFRTSNFELRTSSYPILVLVPRKPERFDEVARRIERAGFSCVRRSQRPDGVAADGLPNNAVVLGDTMGELRKFYSLGDIAFVGRSLVPMGGSDPMEVAGLAKPMVVGPFMENFEMPVRVLQEAQALSVVADGEALGVEVGRLLSDRSAAVEMGARARKVVLRHQGATQRAVDRLVGILGDRQRSARPPTDPRMSGNSTSNPLVIDRVTSVPHLK